MTSKILIRYPMKPFLVIFCMVAMALPANAQTASFQRLDRNADGKLVGSRSGRGHPTFLCVRT